MNDEQEPFNLRQLATRINHLIMPVTIGSLYTCLLVRILSWDIRPDEGIFNGSVNFLTTNGDLSDAVNSLVVFVAFALMIIAVTLFILFALYMRWHKCLSYYFYLPSLIIMAIMTPAIARGVLYSLNSIDIDLITVVIAIWNFTALGLIAIFNVWTSSPLLLQQFYYVHNSAILAIVVIKALPGWAPWMLLSFLVIWDLFAVISPMGPLNLIIDMAERQGVSEMPGLVYTTVTQETGNRVANAEEQSRQSTPEQLEQSPRDVQTIASNSTQQGSPAQANSDGATVKELTNQEVNSSELDLEVKGVNIGLGDFIFFNLMLGLTVRGNDSDDFYTMLATLVSTLVGLVVTMIILGIMDRALPAMPIPIGLGLVTSAITMHLAAPFANELAAAAILI